MITPIISKRTRKVLGYIRDFKPNMTIRHKVIFRLHPKHRPTCFECDGRVKERLDFFRRFGYRPCTSANFAVLYRVKHRPLAVIAHGQRDADELIRAMSHRASREWNDLPKGT